MRKKLGRELEGGSSKKLLVNVRHWVTIIDRTFVRKGGTGPMVNLTLKK